MSLDTQFLTLWMMFVCGCVMGGLLDTYRVVSGQLRLARWLIPLFDVLYWLFAMVIVFHTLYRINLGEVRMFIFLGLLAGIAVYYAALSPYVIRFVRLLLRWLGAVRRFIVRLFLVAVWKPLMFLYHLMYAILMFFGTTTIFLCKFVLQLVYPLWRLLRQPFLALMARLRVHAAIERIRKRLSRFKRDKRDQ